MLPLLHGTDQAGFDLVFTHINTIFSKRSYAMRSVQDLRFGYIWNGWSDGETIFKNEAQSGLTMRAMQKAASTNPEIAARVRHFRIRVPEEFYDYQQDPHALRNLMNDPEMKDHIQEFRAKLRRHMEQTKDPELERFKAVLGQPAK